ncbi:MAG: hypothetical protein AAF203_09625 [Pseudomonadota bacterium]
MKKWILIASLFSIAACSSAPKEEEKPMETPAASEPAPAPAPAPTMTEEKESMTMDSGASMEGGFPDVEGTERSGATCKNGSDERLVSVIDTREGPCGVVYTKMGDKKTVAYAKFDMGFCDKVYENIIGNLTGGGFDCGGAGAASSSEAPAESGSDDAASSEEGQ